MESLRARHVTGLFPASVRPPEAAWSQAGAICRQRRAARAIKNILNPVFPLFPPQPQDRADLCLFLAFQKARGKLTRKRIEMLGDLWAHLQIPADMTPEQARVWLQAHEHEVTPESVQEMVELSAAMEDFEFVPDPNAHLRHGWHSAADIGAASTAALVDR